METTELISALAKVVDAKKSTDKAYRTLSKAFFNGTDEELHNAVIEPPQSPETPQTVDCATDTPKPRETARKRPNRAIGSAQHHQYSALGANGYPVINDASVTMAAMNVRRDTLRDTLHSETYVPRECSTANTPPYW